MYTLWLKSTTYGAESFKYETKQQLLAGINRLIDEIEGNAAIQNDGVERELSVVLNQKKETP